MFVCGYKISIFVIANFFIGCVLGSSAEEERKLKGAASRRIVRIRIPPRDQVWLESFFLQGPYPLSGCEMVAQKCEINTIEKHEKTVGGIGRIIVGPMMHKSPRVLVVGRLIFALQEIRCVKSHMFGPACDKVYQLMMPSEKEDGRRDRSHVERLCSDAGVKSAKEITLEYNSCYNMLCVVIHNRVRGIYRKDRWQVPEPFPVRKKSPVSSEILRGAAPS